MLFFKLLQMGLCYNDARERVDQFISFLMDDLEDLLVYQSEYVSEGWEPCITRLIPDKVIEVTRHLMPEADLSVEEVDKVIKKHTPTFTHYSGNQTFPVGDYDDPTSLFTSLPLWGDTKYGDQRRAYCRHLIGKVDLISKDIVRKALK